MKLTIGREALLAPLQAVVNVVERRQTLPILSNVLINVAPDKMSFTATDMEVEISAALALENPDVGTLTLPARKLLDIARALPGGKQLEIETAETQATIRCEKSRFTLGMLPSTEFPNIGAFEAKLSLQVGAGALRDLIANTQFAMAQQDVRYYLNGLLLEFRPKRLRAVATDGHRLAMSELDIDSGHELESQIIVPRKGISEIARLLDGVDDPVELRVSDNHLQLNLGERSLTTKLIDGKFPDYERVVPASGSKIVLADRELLRQGLARTSILSNEKFRGVRLTLSEGSLKALAHNPEQEEAEEDLEVDYTGESLEIGFNVSYILDVLGVLDQETVQLEFTDANSSCLIKSPEGGSASKYVVMPMRL